MTSSATLQNAYIFHGYAASPNDHWFSWLAKELNRANIRAVVPDLSDSLTPEAAQWQETVHAPVGATNKCTALIAHSLGCFAVLRHLASLTDGWRLGRLILVSGFFDPLPALPELDEFIGIGCDVASLSGHIDEIIVIRSDDDPLVPPPHTDRLAGILGARILVVPGARGISSAGTATARSPARMTPSSLEPVAARKGYPCISGWPYSSSASSASAPPSSRPAGCSVNSHGTCR